MLSKFPHDTTVELYTCRIMRLRNSGSADGMTNRGQCASVNVASTELSIRLKMLSSAVSIPYLPQFTTRLEHELWVLSHGRVAARHPWAALDWDTTRAWR